MSSLRKTIAVEAKLFYREPLAIIFGILFPSVLLLALGAVPALREPSKEFGGARFIEAWAPTTLVLGVGVIALQHIPTVLAKYRENGVLRRLSTTPAHPVTMLLAQFVVGLVATAIAGALAVLTAWLVFDVPLPHQPVLFAVAFVLGFGAVLAVGLLIAAAAPNERGANGLGMLAYMVAMFLGGVFLPRFLLPDALIQVGAYTPPGSEALLRTWVSDAATAAMAGQTSGGSLALQIGIMALIAVAAGYPAVKLFRWQ